MSDQSNFDPQLFLDAQQDKPNVKRPPLPVANPEDPTGAYVGVIGEVKMASGTIEKGTRAGRPWLAAVVPIDIQVPQKVQDQLGLKLETGALRLTEYVMLDLTENNLIDNSVGRNRRQRAYREALDMNKPGDVFSWRKVQGQALKVMIEHEMYQGEPVDKVGAVLKR